jgi:IclR family transcriptional regulator, KDG regulon repressor
MLIRYARKRRSEELLAKEESMQTVTRAIQVLKAFSIQEKEISLTQLSHKLGISKSSLQRILGTLTSEGLLEKDERTKLYKLGMEIYSLGNLVEANSHLLSISKRYMQQLNDQTGETITLNIVHNNKRKCIGYMVSKHELAAITYLSEYSPLYAGASAKVLLAYMPEEKRNQLINEFQLEPVTQNTTTDKDHLEKQLMSIREKGFAITEGERVLGVYAISAPIRNRFNEVIASLTITIPTIRAEKSKVDNYVKWILECTDVISGELGFHFK